MSIATERAGLFAQGLSIVSRETWGAKQSYTSSRPVTRPAKWLFLHISVTIDGGDLPSDEHAAMQVIERVGQQRFGIGFPYNAAAFDTGRLYEGQPLQRRGAHTVNDLPNSAFPEGSINHLARALVLPQMTEDDVTDAQIDAAARWAAACIRAGEVAPGALWFGHRDVTRKGCPGDAGYARLPQLNALTRHYETSGLTAPNLDEVVQMMTVKNPYNGRFYLLQNGKLSHVGAGNLPPVPGPWKPDTNEWVNLTKATGNAFE